MPRTFADHDRFDGGRTTYDPTTHNAFNDVPTIATSYPPQFASSMNGEENTSDIDSELAPGLGRPKRSSAATSSDTGHRTQLRAWLSYALASEVFATCSLSLFLPICLEQFARDNGVLDPGRTMPCPRKGDEGLGEKEMLMMAGRCVVRVVGGVWVDTASFSLYIYSASVAIQALTVISMGGVADYPPHRKRLLLLFASLGSLATTSFIFLPSLSPLWPLCALLAIAANVGFGASMVALNAYLPGLARTAPEVVAMRSSSASSVSPENSDDDEREQYQRAIARSTAHISAKGIAIGYAGGIFVLLICLVPVMMLGGTTWSLRVAIAISGIWWAAGTVPSALWLRSGEEDSDGLGVRGRGAGLGREVVMAWKRLGEMLRPSEIKKLKNTFVFLAAWFLLSDGFTSITSTAVLFASTTLHMPASSLILVSILSPIAGIAGSLLFPRVQKYMGWTNERTLVWLVGGAALVPVYGCLGFLIEGSGTRFGGLTTPGEMYGLAILFGGIYGPFQSYARSVFSEVIPKGEEARWFGLYSITDKSSSFLGPLIVGLISDATGNMRYAFFFLIGMMLLPIPILLLALDVKRGREDAERYAEGRDRSGGRAKDVGEEERLVGGSDGDLDDEPHD
ncbi:Autophagy protein 22 [Tulasnella sp. JGI-2019a]|nr:Autophagy protein 22 [Tulasnella sp. JGI-2019a]KAG8999920.1 Autophagy protein 22 [Tulasnella sp. JGI-2019a]